MKLPPHISLLRRAVMWTAGVVLVVSVAAWCVSFWTVAWAPGAGRVALALWKGCLSLWDVGEGRAFGPRGLSSRGVSWPPRWWFDDRNPFFSWRPATSWRGATWRLFVPLWIPSATASVVLVAMLLDGRRVPRRG